MLGARDSIREAVEGLATELRERLRRHPPGHLAGGGEWVELRLRLPTGAREDALAHAASLAAEALDETVGELFARRRIFRPSRIFCLRCGTTDCAHAAPGASTAVFTGYGPSGLPRFADFGQWLLAVQDPRVDLLYRDPPSLLSRVSSGSQLTADLLAAFRDGDNGYRLHGQVAAGWYRLPDGSGRPQPLAVTFQILSSQGRRGRRCFGLNLLAVGPQGEGLEALCDRLGEIPWAAAVGWAQEALRRIEQWCARNAAGGDELDRRLDGILRGLARRLDKDRRARGRRTRHAQERHAAGERPTWKALADLERAKPDDFLADTRSRALVVLGERGRAHLFNEDGKLVTSVRYGPGSVERKVARGLWRPARLDEVDRLCRQALAAHAPDVP